MEQSHLILDSKCPAKGIPLRKGSLGIVAVSFWLVIIAMMGILLTPTTASAAVKLPEPVDASAFTEQVFIPALGSDSATRTSQGFAEVSALEGSVDMCFVDTGAGKTVYGTLPGQDESNYWAGVLNVTVNDVPQKAFCTDIGNNISPGCYSNSTIGATDPLVACTLQYYPPVGGLSSDEAAARQATVWHFSDEFELASPTDVKTLYDGYVADILNKQANGQCDALLTPTLTVDPSSAVNFLAPDGNGGFFDSEHEYTIKLRKGALPVANSPVTVTTNLGSLSSGALSGTTIVVTTDAQGDAKVVVTHNAPGTATLVAAALVELPNGTRIDPAATTQKIVVSGNELFPLQASATKQWEAGGKIVIRKFHDVDRNGVYNAPPDSLINWDVRYRQEDGSDFTGDDGWIDLALGDDGTETIGVELGENYQVCEVIDVDWEPTTPICYAGVTDGNTVEFGNVELPALLIIKYHDLNGNGVRDAGEEGLDGWQFNVERFENSTWLDSYSGQTTNGGSLAFSNMLWPFNYRVIETAQTDWYSSTATLQTVNITQNALYTVTFGNLQPGSLTVNKNWFSNNVQVEAPEAATICLQRTPAAPAQAPIPTVGGFELTLVDGKYCAPVEDTVTIDDLWPGNYTVTETPVEDWNVVLASQETTIVSGETQTVTFRNNQILASLGDYVWVDEDKDGIQDNTEEGKSGVTVELWSACVDGELIDSMTTDAEGGYLFDNLVPGDYVVKFILPNGYVFTTPLQGGNAGLDSNADTTSEA